MEADQRIARWRQIVRAADSFETPYYLLWRKPFIEAVARAGSVTSGISKIRQWYSYKSQPVPTLARTAGELGMGIEVVSPFELYAARRMGFAPSNILVNGLGKDRWLPDDLSHLNVIFDSVHEAEKLAQRARALRWRCGLRIAVSAQINADAPQFPAQFGIDRSDVERVVRTLRSNYVDVSILHFHLRSNVPSTLDYLRALEELREVADLTRLTPRIIDIGGGLSDTALQRHPQIGSSVSIDQLDTVVAAAKRVFPDSDEIWLENGRVLLAPAGILVVSVIDIKERGGFRILICDGGRANNALPSDWEEHRVALANAPTDAQTRNTLICGPTCMAFDSFYQGPFISDVRIGDRIIYFNAGAYHIPWETRFSFGECRVLWTTDGERMAEIRKAEPPEEWFGRWDDL